jgi:hybrid cluster-associated redox disulfide protein
MEITKDTIIDDVLKAHPESIRVFMKYNLGCIGCMGAAGESIEVGARMHGLDPEPLVKELNELFGGKTAETK